MNGYPDWRERQKHSNDVERVLRETGMTDEEGIMRRWDPDIVIPALKIAGHTSTSYERCECHK